MTVLHVTHADEETGMVAAITDEPCPCGWPETILHIHPDGRTMRGCASCEAETEVTPDGIVTRVMRGVSGAILTKFDEMEKNRG